MARLRDVPLVCRKVGFRRFALRVWDQVVEDHVFIFAAAVAYAWLFAIFPFFVFLANLAGVLLATLIRYEAVTSVWCFYAAFVSGFIALALRRAPAPA